ncbi:ABC transporter permease [Flavihumibacter solisilvae]|uniref:ABC transporter permease n=1 Tax=Flavihumibacter solisilvae TaxID=1349421 RepID=A0A0C1IQD5_9BACT|nr:ABC transporter permease [Flavihumibacter solisilvae]KIC92684.1 hypothetical protein OI18_21420 [Flavihumibacter solisilvae]
MFFNSLKIAWRNLFRNRLHSIINIGGLIIGFTIGILILLVVYDQLSYDKFHVNRDRLYQAYQVFGRKTGDDYVSQFGFAAAPAFKEEAPAIARASRFAFGGGNVVYNDKELDITVMLVDEDFLPMFSFPVVAGNSGNPLQSLSGVVITEATAKKIFGNENAVGKTLKVSTGELKAMTVMAVVKDCPLNSSIRFDMLARVENRSDFARDRANWDRQHHPVFIELKEGATQQQAENEIRSITRKHLAEWYAELERDGGRPDKNGDVYAAHLMPFSKLHFAPRVNDRAINKAVVYTVMTVGILIILIACFNFVNINLAKAFTRSKEIGVRKCLGAGKTRLFSQLWTESFLLCTVAFLISLTAVNLLLHSISGIQRINANLATILWKPDFLLLAVAVLVAVSFIAGGYPSWLMARFQVAETLKGKVTLRRKSLLRSSLIVIQFVIACIMISCTGIIYRQFKHLQNGDLGFNKEHVISIPLNKPENGRQTIEKLRTRLSSQSSIRSITGSNINIGRGRDGSTTRSAVTFEYQGELIKTLIASVDYNYLETFGLKTINGRDFDRSYASDTQQNVIISESMARQFREKDITGKSLSSDTSAPRWNIIGVFPDFHLYSLREPMQPLTLVINPSDEINYCFIKTSGSNMVGTIDLVKKEMETLEPGKEFRGSYLDENINNWYEQERTMSLMFSIAALISVILSCMGLLAMVLLMIQQRVKEIGMRKVLGASVQQISFLISRDFLGLVGLAVLIATPVSWLVMNKWLEDFAYRIPIRWWMFGLMAIIAIIVALLTISFNTIRAARQNPVKSLRTE